MEVFVILVESVFDLGRQGLVGYCEDLTRTTGRAGPEVRGQVRAALRQGRQKERTRAQGRLQQVSFAGYGGGCPDSRYFVADQNKKKRQKIQ